MTDSFPSLSVYGLPYATFQPHLNVLLFDVLLALLFAGGLVAFVYLTIWGGVQTNRGHDVFCWGHEKEYLLYLNIWQGILSMA